MPERQQDLFMQFAAGQVTSGADSSTLVEAEVATGLTIRGNYAWLIHFFEFAFSNMPDYTSDITLQAAFSVRQGESSKPAVDEAGTICVINRSLHFTTSGAWAVDPTARYDFLPPIIVANPKLSVYFQTSVNSSVFQSKIQRFRIAYTTVPIDNQTYLEIAETWEVV